MYQMYAYQKKYGAEKPGGHCETVQIFRIRRRPGIFRRFGTEKTDATLSFPVYGLNSLLADIVRLILILRCCLLGYTVVFVMIYLLIYLFLFLLFHIILPSENVL